jgi:spore coat polysaccharide biosynthesis predicted glycosyltransferase SpsG
MVIDDLADRPHDCDVLLDQNYANSSVDRYTGLLSRNCRTLYGPKYALISRHYGAFRQTLQPRDGLAKKVMVFFGGTDPSNASALALEALSQDGLRHLEVHVVLGPNNPHRQSLEKLAKSRGQTVLHGPQRSLAAVMREADLAVGAGGTTTWERMCMGLPAVVVSVADNQTRNCESLAEAGLIHYMGPQTKVDPSRLAAGLRQLVSEPGALARLSARAAECVDGLGAARVAEVLFPSTIADLRVRRSFGTSWGPQVGDAPGDAGSICLVAEAGGVPVGHLSIQAREDGMCVDWRLDPIVKGRDWDAHAVDRAIRHVQTAVPLALGRRAARSYFRAGEGVTGGSATAGSLYSIAILSDGSSWLNWHIVELQYQWLRAGHRVLWAHDKDDLRPGDFCFLLGCSQIVPPELLKQFKHGLVVHESDLPRGRGWSPLTWQILEGANRIPVTLLEAAPKVDSGTIYAQEWLTFEGHELIDDLRLAAACATLRVCDLFIRGYPEALDRGREQIGAATRYPRRTPEDSQLDPNASIRSQFSLFRVVDNDRYPAFFELGGHHYRLRIEESPDDQPSPPSLER